uniref:Uncharacterized protein n=1 Tax=Arundo donax TaxID=35708 RepID=A0A0A9DU22_ARUDO
MEMEMTFSSQPSINFLKQPENSSRTINVRNRKEWNGMRWGRKESCKLRHRQQESRPGNGSERNGITPATGHRR